MRFLAAEKLSEHKYKTPEGYLVCVDAVLSRTGKQKYMRSELFGDECKNPTDEVEVDRLEADVFDEKAMASFENKPICIEHPDEDVNVANHNDLSVGFVRDIKRGTDNGQPVMLGTLVITDENAIDLVESGEYAELSCGYDCDIADDEHPTQRNIRGNHVALCKQGRAGIARIVDSVKDSLVSAEKLEIGMRINYRGKIYTVEAVTSNELYKGEYDLLLKSDDGAQRVLETGGSDRFTVVDSTKDVTGIIKALIYKSTDNVTNARFTDFIGDGTVKLDNGIYMTFWHSAVAHAEVERKLQNATDVVAFATSAVDGHLDRYDLERLGEYAKYKNEIAKAAMKYFGVKDSKGDTMKDADYEQWTKQGWRVVALYKDGGRIHAIVERKSGDFVVALGYNTSTGEWAQGRYVSTFGAAVDTLNEEKPGAVPIRDAKPEKKTFEVSFVKDGVTYVRKVKADSLQDAIIKAKDEVSTAHKVVVFTQNMLSEMGKNNSIGKYDRVISAMRQLYGQSFLPDDKLKEAIRRELPRLLKKYGLQDTKDAAMRLKLNERPSLQSDLQSLAKNIGVTIKRVGNKYIVSGDYNKLTEVIDDLISLRYLDRHDVEML